MPLIACGGPARFGETIKDGTITRGVKSKDPLDKEDLDLSGKDSERSVEGSDQLRDHLRIQTEIDSIISEKVRVESRIALLKEGERSKARIRTKLLRFRAHILTILDIQEKLSKKLKQFERQLFVLNLLRLDLESFFKAEGDRSDVERLGNIFPPLKDLLATSFKPARTVAEAEKRFKEALDRFKDEGSKFENDILILKLAFKKELDKIKHDNLSFLNLTGSFKEDFLLRDRIERVIRLLESSYRLSQDLIFSLSFSPILNIFNSS